MRKERWLENRVAVITGGGRGLGRAISFALAEEGAKVFVFSRTGKYGKEVAEEIISCGGKAISMEGSVGNESHVEKMIHEVMRVYGDIHILVNNAGLVGRQGLFEQVTTEDWDDVIRINLTGTFLCCRAVLPFMKKKRFGKIIVVGSTAGLRMGFLGGVHYAASKSGLNSFVRHLAFEAAPYGINVNMVLPGPVATHMRTKKTVILDEIRRRQVPMGRFIEPREVADAVVFLASDKARMITGCFLPIDGGLLTGWCEPEVYFTKVRGLKTFP
jgi:NAD(P)-dependent dehydrogenase (short-subunit alcohol dehydrogenase family)